MRRWIAALAAEQIGNNQTLFQDPALWYQAVLWGIRHQNRYAEDANNSTDQPEKHCGARDDTYADQRKQVDCQRDRGG